MGDHGKNYRLAWGDEIRCLDCALYVKPILARHRGRCHRRYLGRGKWDGPAVSIRCTCDAACLPNQRGQLPGAEGASDGK